MNYVNKFRNIEKARFRIRRTSNTFSRSDFSINGFFQHYSYSFILYVCFDWTMPIVRLTHNISSALHIGLNIVERVQTLLVVLHIVCVYYTTDVMDDISLLVSLSPNPNPAERLQEKGSNGKRFDFFFIWTFYRLILFPDPLRSSHLP